MLGTRGALLTAALHLDSWVSVVGLLRVVLDRGASAWWRAWPNLVAGREGLSTGSRREDRDGWLVGEEKRLAQVGWGLRLPHVAVALQGRLGPESRGG